MFDVRLPHILRDYMGSVTHIADEVAQLGLVRGYIGQEHLPWYGLINMNARLYDPTLGRFISPDPYVQMPELPQNFNRYSYALNNPLKYKDPSGNFVLFTLLFATVESLYNLCAHGLNFSSYTWNKTVNSWKLSTSYFKGNFKQVLGKLTWGFVNSFAGDQMAQWCNIFTKLKISELDGCLAIGGVTKDGSAMTVGHFSMGPKGYKADWRDHLFVHEYGHYMQSQLLGPLYLPVIAKQSLISAAILSKLGPVEHKDRWFEMDASKRGGRYFSAHYGKDAIGDNSTEYFDRASFTSGSGSPYINPRTGNNKQESHPDSGSKLTVWDFIF